MKSYNITAPRIITDAPDLFKSFMVAHNMTTDLREEFDSYGPMAKTLRYTDPFSEDAFQADEDFWHIPFFSIGDVDGNGIFARVSAQHTDPSTLYIAFRPMNLHGVDELVKRDQFDGMAKFSGMKPITPSDKGMNVDNLIEIIRTINDTTVAEGLGINASFYRLLMHSKHNVTIENSFSLLGKKTKKNHWNAHFGKNIPLMFTEHQRVSIIQAISSFITYYKPREVVFTGFSYGSSLAMTASILVHRVIQETQNVAFSVFQFAGSKVCDTEGRDYAVGNFKKVAYVALTRDHKTLDPVSALPNHNLVHVGDMYCMDVSRHTIRMGSCTSLTSSSKQNMKSLVLGFVMKQKSADTFKSIHLAGEDMIKRILLAYMIDHKLQTPVIDINTIPCDFFSSAGYPAKYRVCPQTSCIVKTDEKQQNQCIQANPGNK